MEQLKDYRVEVKVKNNLLYSAMISNGYETAADLSRKTGIQQSIIGRCLNLKYTLYNKQGHIRPPWVTISELFHLLPEDLLPETHWNRPLEKNTGSFDASIADIDYLLPPKEADALCIESQFHQKINEALETIPPREAKILELRFGLNGNEEHTLIETGDIYGVTGSRIRQIEERALRKLKHPTITRHLRDFVEN